MQPLRWLMVVKFDYQASLIWALADLLICKFWFFFIFSVVILFLYGILGILSVRWSIVSILWQWLFGQPLYFSKCSWNWQNKTNICNITGEMYPVELRLHICRTFSGMMLRALGRASGACWERSVFIWTLPSRLDFAAESCGISMLC